MKIDREVVDVFSKMDRVTSNIARTLDIAFVPTSFVRTVMRREDNYQGHKNWEGEFFNGRYHSKSKARWAFPIAYSIAGILEGARIVGAAYSAIQLFN